jgi:hypothetical protein
MLDLFCGRWGWSKAFAARGWECFGIDLVEPPEIPEHCHFQKMDVLNVTAYAIASFDFICASSPCEQFSVHGMKHFHPNPPYPYLGRLLFNHTRSLCEKSGVPYVMENVRAAQKFVGQAVHHCGPFYLWGSGVPVLLHKGIIKGWSRKWIDKQGRVRDQGPTGRGGGKANGSELASNGELTARAATIPPELANCVADYAERLLEQRESQPASRDAEQGK